MQLVNIRWLCHSFHCLILKEWSWGRANCYQWLTQNREKSPNKTDSFWKCLLQFQIFHNKNVNICCTTMLQFLLKRYQTTFAFLCGLCLVTPETSCRTRAREQLWIYCRFHAHHCTLHLPNRNRLIRWMLTHQIIWDSFENSRTPRILFWGSLYHMC